jgi:TrmH family RNA methyltransferase
VLDGFEKPGNIGAAFRCADAAGVGAVILTPKSADPLNPNAIRGSLGTVFTLPFAVADESEARRWLAARRYRTFAARVESSKPLWECDFSGPTAIVIGNEAGGLGDHWSAATAPGDVADDIHAVRIPMAGSVDSLNASASAAVLLFEARRQRTAVGM